MQYHKYLLTTVFWNCSCLLILANKFLWYHYLRLGLKSTYSSACVELLAVEMKLKRRKTRSGTPSSWVSCLWMICSLNDICCCVFLRNRYQPMTFYMIKSREHLWKIPMTFLMTTEPNTVSTIIANLLEFKSSGSYICCLSNKSWPSSNQSKILFKSLIVIPQKSHLI